MAKLKAHGYEIARLRDPATGEEFAFMADRWILRKAEAGAKFKLDR